MYVVISIIERDIESVVPAESYELAIELANEKLAKHMKDVGHESVLDTGEDREDEWCEASAASPIALANYCGNFDCHICQLPPVRPN